MYLYLISTIIYFIKIFFNGKDTLKIWNGTGDKSVNVIYSRNFQKYIQNANGYCELRELNSSDHGLSVGSLYMNKLWTVHLNDQYGLKFDQDKSFGSVDIRRAFNQVRILDKHDYGKNGEWVGLDVKAMRTQKDDVPTRHLSNSREVFLMLLEISRSLNEEFINKCIKERDYEELDLYIIKSLIR